VGFVSYSGHGYINGFGTYPPDGERRVSYLNPYALFLFNGDKLPVFFFDACLTATLDHKVFTLFKYPGFAYNLLRKSNGGAIATIGATRTAFTHVDNSGVHGGAGYLNLHFFMNYEEGKFISDIFIGSQNDYLNHVGLDCITIEEFIIIGDPTLEIGGYS